MTSDVKPPRPLLFRWQDAWCSPLGPEPTTRLVLHCIKKHLGVGEHVAWPSQELLAEETGLSLRAVKIHLDKVELTGWMGRKRRIVRRGRREITKTTEYWICFPRGFSDATLVASGKPPFVLPGDPRSDAPDEIAARLTAARAKLKAKVAAKKAARTDAERVRNGAPDAPSLEPSAPSTQTSCTSKVNEVHPSISVVALGSASGSIPGAARPRSAAADGAELGAIEEAKADNSGRPPHAPPAPSRKSAVPHLKELVWVQTMEQLKRGASWPAYSYGAKLGDMVRRQGWPAIKPILEQCISRADLENDAAMTWIQRRYDEQFKAAHQSKH